MTNITQEIINEVHKRHHATYDTKISHYEISRIIDAYIAALPNGDGWKDISEAPEDASQVLVYTDAGDILKAVFFKVYGRQEGYVLDHDIELHNQKIIKWQFLPTPPKGNE